MSASVALLNFECKSCGACCRIRGYVRINDADISRIAAFMALDADVFIEEHTRLLPDRTGLALLEDADGVCVHLQEDKNCGIHSVKPEQCRNFPYTWRYLDVESICEGWKACIK